MGMIYNFRDDVVYLQGDSHEWGVNHETISLRIPDGSDYISLGDSGLMAPNHGNQVKEIGKWLDKTNELCKGLNVNCYLIRGNHEIPALWDSSNLSNIFFLKTGDVGIFPNGKRALLVGGGISVDRYVRKEGVNYWKDEITPRLENIEPCDYVFSHDCPEWFNHPTRTLPHHFEWYVERDPTLMDEAQKQRETMNDIITRSGVKVHFSGHYHVAVREEKFGCYYRCLDINEIFEFDSTKEYKL